jgi:hypothetical protein
MTLYVYESTFMFGLNRDTKNMAPRARLNWYLHPQASFARSFAGEYVNLKGKLRVGYRWRVSKLNNSAYIYAIKSNLGLRQL